ncbi:MAG TPA: hypothetical protein VMR62_07060 [Bryobacteraceae bacterium]|jgi:hypothetical protein|nr:hypothetical protein [Bryobacteraceae bacterium]
MAVIEVDSCDSLGERCAWRLSDRGNACHDVYQVVGYYLKHSAELAGYFEGREREERELLDAHQGEWSPKGLRARLLARRKNP